MTSDQSHQRRARHSTDLLVEKAGEPFIAPKSLDGVATTKVHIDQKANSRLPQRIKSDSRERSLACLADPAGLQHRAPHCLQRMCPKQVQLGSGVGHPRLIPADKQLPAHPKRDTHRMCHATDRLMRPLK
jgi:hypothetical protein